MPITPAKRHYQKAKALAAEQAAQADGYADATQYELMLMQLAAHKRQLSQIQSVERKVEQKRLMLPEYAAYVEGVLASGAGAQDDVLMTIMVWRIDTGDIEGALAVAEYALAHGLTTPEQYHRDTATLVAEEIAEGTRTTPLPPAVLLRVLELTTEHDMPDEVRAKLHKAIGLALAETDVAAALEHLKRALALHDKVGVKKDIERLERELRKQTEGT